jgi:hypothetical protein
LKLINHDKFSKRPLSVWLTQALLFFTILQLSFSILLGLFACLSQTVSCPPQLMASRFILAAGTAGILLIAFRGLQHRKRYGRWLGIIFLSIVVIGGVLNSRYFQLIYHSIIQAKSLPAPPYDCWEGGLMQVEQNYCGYSSYLDFAMRSSLDIIFPQILFGLLPMRLMLSRAAKSFFADTET